MERVIRRREAWSWRRLNRNLFLPPSLMLLKGILFRTQRMDSVGLEEQPAPSISRYAIILRVKPDGWALDELSPSLGTAKVKEF
ncbi:hypothetical protein KY285_011248 [Solanum tuberosum]|nr:hypothetical protein KY285_011248 [Solanum tuberosum]